MSHRDAQLWFGANPGPDTIIISDVRRIACGLGCVDHGGRQKKKPTKIEQLDLDGRHLSIYEDGDDVTDWTGFPEDAITTLCDLGGGRFGGYLWRYAS